MSSFFFPEYDEIIIIQGEIIRETGGSEGLRDANGLESALHAAKNRYNYETDDLPKLAATFAYHLSQAHAFIDGNKRVAAVVAELFLNLNGAELNADNNQIVELYLDIAAGKMTRDDVEEKFAEWVTPAENKCTNHTKKTQA